MQLVYTKGWPCRIINVVVKARGLLSASWNNGRLWRVAHRRGIVRDEQTDSFLPFCNMHRLLSPLSTVQDELVRTPQDFCCL